MATSLSSHRPYVQTQPRLSHLSLQGFLNLPRRLCAPPHAVGKVRSFGLTPIFDVTLDDVLDRKHLPPLSLKDFEEWLLFVEQCPENLYFIIWLRDYTAKYDRWMNKVRAREEKIRARDAKKPGHNRSTSTYRVAWSARNSPTLALFFARARETFFAPMSPYELVLPPELLSPFFVAASPSPHPDPAVFAPLKAHIEACLRVSLHRFVRSAYTNVGSYRAACGICAGIIFLLVGAIPPVVVNFVKHQARWERLAALPGLWIGLTVLIASLRGVCMMIYLFGDFRQLRRFELERPPLPVSPTETTFSARDFIEHGDAPSTLPSVSIAVPTRPVRALTAPPKIAIRIPTRPSTLSTPTLTLGTTSVTGMSSESSMSASDSGKSAGRTVHTISISSLKGPGGSSTLAHWSEHEHRDDAETRSVASSIPAYSDDLSEDDSSIGSEDEDEDEDEHGIYISPAMPPSDEAAEADPAVVNAALALMVAAGTHSNTPRISLTMQALARAGPETLNCAAGPGTPVSYPSPLSAASTDPSPSTYTQTAPFIPSYPYSSSGPSMTDFTTSVVSGRTSKSARRISRRFGCADGRDLETGLSTSSALTDLASGEDERAREERRPLPIGPFDFDALPPLAAVPKARVTDAYVDEKKDYVLGTSANADLERDEGDGRGRRTTSRMVTRLTGLFRPSSASVSAKSKSNSSPRALFAWHGGVGGGAGWRGRCAIEQRTPAFGPVTRVLEPVVARAQWEIVVRAGTLAAVLSALLAGVLVVLPVPT